MSKLTLQTATVNGANLEFGTRGEGEPVLFIHGALVEAFVPLWDEPALEPYRVIAYSRRGYGNSERVGTIDIPAHANDSVALLDILGIERAHIVGHSYSPLIALELALKHPERVHSLVLLETALPGVLLSSPEVGTIANETYARYQAGDVEGAFDRFFSGFLGPDFRSVIYQMLPTGAVERGVKDMATLLENDFPALQNWSFGPEEAKRIVQPTLLVTGTDTLPVFQEAHRQLQQWLPEAETLTPATSHSLMMERPRDVARGMVDFFVRHPLKVYA